MAQLHRMARVLGVLRVKARAHSKTRSPDTCHQIGRDALLMRATAPPGRGGGRDNGGGGPAGSRQSWQRAVRPAQLRHPVH